MSISAIDPSAPLGTTPTQLLLDFQHVQETRARQYAQFHSGFRMMLESSEEGPYMRLVARTTEVFNNCSRRVIAVEGALREMGRQDLGDLLRRVQESERDKLRLTLSVQALRRAEALGGFSWQQVDFDPLAPRQFPNIHVDDDGISDLSLSDSHTHTHAHTNGPAHHDHCCGHGQGPYGLAPDEEPTEREFRAALQEAVHALDATVVGINDILEEVRYALAELQEAELEVEGLGVGA